MLCCKWTGTLSHLNTYVMHSAYWVRCGQLMEHVLGQFWWLHSHWIFALQHQHVYWIHWGCEWAVNFSKAFSGSWLWLVLRAWLPVPAQGSILPACSCMELSSGTWALYPGWGDAAATCLSSSSTSSKSEHVSQKHTKDADRARHIECHGQGAVFNGTCV